MDKVHINWRIIVRYMLGKSTMEEDVLVDEWLQEDIRHQEYYKKAQYYFDTYYAGEEEVHDVDMEGAWNEFLVYTGKISRNRLWRQYLKYVAVVTILLGVTGAFWMLLKNRETHPVIAEYQRIKPGSVKAMLVLNSGNQVVLTDSTIVEQILEKYADDAEVDAKAKVEYNTIIVPRGGEYSLTLVDGTRIKMNADSKLSFPNKFTGKERRVRLEGEALFDVTKDDNIPFVVETTRGSIKVLGTLFNVNVYPDEDMMYATLVEGQIAFKGNEMLQEIKLVPGEQVTYNVRNGESKVLQINPEVYIGWAEGKWLIEGAKLEDMMKQLARWYDVEVFYKNPEAKELVFTGDLEKYNDCEVVLDIISMTTNVVFEIKDKVIIVQVK